VFGAEDGLVEVAGEVVKVSVLLGEQFTDRGLATPA